ncbi:Uncharacterised protein [Mycobacteroides abscessus subsp. abscessus]|nr:hypothetical protein MBOL_01750 [Mycobacteroides abscessus subsp. bolletii BD]SHR49164.1 Uncharacterised protein [Mycobacteroides abscessus subsp. bolletii]SHR99853.1 Uncharacterised protein [Mycobacteroides abscessus subsp. abscessus]SHT24035.1 Uncharacterised protein [Mycobacteroides abscessus subsp. bolletii]SHT62049.1 Uncharacterised protein [Mycobacteroides abscessus subsp. bolletii]
MQSTGGVGCARFDSAKRFELYSSENEPSLLRASASVAMI